MVVFLSDFYNDERKSINWREKKVEDTQQIRREQAVCLRMQKYASVQVYSQNLLSSLPSWRIIIKRAGCAQAEAYYSLRR